MSARPTSAALSNEGAQTHHESKYRQPRHSSLGDFSGAEIARMRDITIKALGRYNEYGRRVR